jgi:hypothetical protein
LPILTADELTGQVLSEINLCRGLQKLLLLILPTKLHVKQNM